MNCSGLVVYQANNNRYRNAVIGSDLVRPNFVDWGIKQVTFVYNLMVWVGNLVTKVPKKFNLGQCAVCYEQLEGKNIYLPLNCSHTTCRYCVVKYVEGAVKRNIPVTQNRKVMKIPCI